VGSGGRRLKLPDQVGGHDDGADSLGCIVGRRLVEQQDVGAGDVDRFVHLAGSVEVQHGGLSHRRAGQRQHHDRGVDVRRQLPGDRVVWPYPGIHSHCVAVVARVATSATVSVAPVTSRSSG